jgi:radical SAM protein with 4Fe4S-binding SPASM domain
MQVESSVKNLPTSPHPLEKILQYGSVRFFLRKLTQRNGNGRCGLEEIFTAYESPSRLSRGKRMRYLLPSFSLELLRKRAGVQKSFLIKEVIGYPPRARGLVNTSRSIGLYGLTNPQIFDSPLMVVWNFTQACNLRCHHCYQNAGTALPDELSWEEQMDVIDQLIDADVSTVAFSGGEPLLSPTLLPAARRAHEGGLYVTIATNGTLIDGEMARKLVDHGVEYVEISLDSIHPEIHNSFRGKECWSRAVRGIENAVRQPGLKVGMATTLTRENFPELEELIAFAKNLGVQCFNAFNFIPTGRGKNISAEDLSPAMREEVLGILWKHLQEGKIEIWSTAPQFARVCLMHFSGEGLYATGHAGTGAGNGARLIAKYIGGCGAGRCYCAIQPNGVVTPCVYIPLPIGNLREKRLLDIWHNSPICQTLRHREEFSSHCRICGFRAYCGGCRARAFAYLGDLTEADPGCFYNEDKWKALSSNLEVERGKEVFVQADSRKPLTAA